MPLYEYRCGACAHTFEALVRNTEGPACPSCGANDLERLTSLFAVNSEGTRQAARASSLPRAQRAHVDKEAGERQDYERHRH